MKKNLSLLGLLLILLFVAQKFFHDDVIEKKIFWLKIDYSKFNKIYLNDLELSARTFNNEKKFWLTQQGIPAETRAIDLIFNYLGKIKLEVLDPTNDINVINKFKAQKNFSLTLLNEEGGIHIHIGTLNYLSGKFFLSYSVGSEEKFFFATDTNAAQKAYKNNVEASKQKYALLMKVLNLGETGLMNRTILFGVDFSKIYKANFSRKGDYKYSLNFENLNTKPAPHEKIVIEKTKIKEFKEVIQNIQFVAVHKTKKLDKQVARIMLLTKDNDNTTLDLYVADGKYFIKTNLNNKIYELPRYQEKVFNFALVYFWKSYPTISYGQTINVHQSKRHVIPVKESTLGKALKMMFDGNFRTKRVAELSKDMKKLNFIFRVDGESGMLSFFEYSNDVYILDHLKKLYFIYEKSELPDMLYKTEFLKKNL